MSGHSLKRLLAALPGDGRDAKVHLERAQTSPEYAAMLERALLRECVAAGIDPNDAFFPPPSPDALGSQGILVGRVPGVGPLHYPDVEMGALLLGQPGAGKTSAGIHYLLEAHRLGYGGIIIDRRGDWWPVARTS